MQVGGAGTELDLALMAHPCHVRFAGSSACSRSTGAVLLRAPACADLTAGAPGEIRADTSGLLRDRPGVQELFGRPRTGEPAAWASAAGGEDWVDRLDDPEFAEQITAAMDARGRVLAPALAAVLADVPMHSIRDIAGGSGVYACALLDAAPQARATVLNFLRSIVRRGTLPRRRGYGEVDVVTADMLMCCWLATICTSTMFDYWQVQAIQQLLCASYAALPSGGWVVDYDAHLNEEQRAPVAAYSVLHALDERSPLLRRRDRILHARRRLRRSRRFGPQPAIGARCSDGTPDVRSGDRNVES